MATDALEVRCPAGSGNLFARVKNGYWEIACPGCRRTLRAIGADVRYILHRYEATGEYVDTLTILTDEAVDIP